MVQSSSSVVSIEKLDLTGSPSLQPEVKKTNLDDKIISGKDLHFQGETGLTIKTLDAAGPTISADGDGNPHFIFTIQPYTISNRVLYLPKDFANSNGLINRTEMILVDEKQRKWPVLLGPNGTHFGIKMRGWSQLLKSNGVRAGDTYKFELISNGTIPIAYFHFLHRSSSLQPEVKKVSDEGLYSQEQKEGLRTKTSDTTAPISQEPASKSADDDSNPHFVSTIKPNTISCRLLYLPVAFAKSNGLLSRRKMILVDEKRRSWSVQLGRKGDSLCCIKRGWQRFMKANGLRVGDSYKFELINNGTIPRAYFHCNYSGKGAN